jgi:hypothetical protein
LADKFAAPFFSYAACLSHRRACTYDSVLFAVLGYRNNEFHFDTPRVGRFAGCAFAPISFSSSSTRAFAASTNTLTSRAAVPLDLPADKPSKS